MIIKSYVEDYVICSECGKPDTRLVKDDRVMILRCDACGSHRPVRKRKAGPSLYQKTLRKEQSWTWRSSPSPSVVTVS